MERQPQQDDDVTLHFCLDGVIFALRQNMMTEEQAYENLKKWFPDVEILPNAFVRNDTERRYRKG